MMLIKNYTKTLGYIDNISLILYFNNDVFIKLIK